MKEAVENLFIPVKNLQDKCFVVKDYQRGFKWTDKEIIALLNDVNDHREIDGKYCLQPVIVKTLEDNTIELIDGQQRITSIYLLLYYLRQKQFYTISYQTRPATKTFLENELTTLHQTIIDKKTWQDFIATYPNYNNVDIFHLFEVYVHIHKWFTNPDILSDGFLEKLINNVNIIWYDILTSNTNNKLQLIPEQVFLNLNAGKIPLTSSELIKALFILEAQNKHSKEVAKLKATELATEWDQIETKLHDDLFWFFICDNKQYNNAATRIDFIIDLVNKRNPKKHDSLYSYRLYETKFKEQKDLDWKSIKKTFNKLLEWYDNKKVYHLVGFLIVSGLKKLSSIIELSKGKTKVSFEVALENEIKKAFSKTKKRDNKEIEIYNLENLHYENLKKQCSDILLLLNITYYINSNSPHKFPFNLFKNENWSVEHINPQNPRDFKTVQYLLEWLVVNKEYYSKNDNKAIIELLDKVLVFAKKLDSSKTLKDNKLTKDQVQDLEDLTERITVDLGLHGVSNLALLDVNTNSKIGNKPFLEKREELLKLDQEGKYVNSKGEIKLVYLPICTKNVFSKIYTTDKKSTVKSFFGKEDMDAYRLFIEKQLKPYYK
ncbi:DUF262 domain-containing protein [Tenacibaculum finnmarkense]|uniref:DUF262 domain-containing protein n=1 Tax=Tenacibaculum finnmarkense TaxID=2781243 RepID=UPI001EFB7018|nr:DUF262 domain-containing protein [Tenacibaculum finnmarkense]MCG8785172.1 DUF262 domain-containing protein [Tenacibaculum finnmarkense]